MKNKTLYTVLVIILIFVGFIFVIYQGKNSSQTSIPSSLPVSTPNASIQPIVNITPNSTIKSPLTVTGTVPVGWMFEGNVPVKLLDENRKVIAQAPGGEDNAGTWMDEEPDEFTATLTFTTVAKSGYLVISKDNPSGLPENDESYEIPVKF